MKRITIEQAERIPPRLSMRMHLNKTNESTCNQIKGGWEHFDHHCVKTWRFVRKFISKYVGRPYNTCYSDFLHRIDEDRRFNHGTFRDEMIREFKDEFAEYESNYRYREWATYCIDDMGLIQKTGYSGYHKAKKPVYKEQRYIFTPENSRQSNIFAQYFWPLCDHARTIGLTAAEYNQVIKDVNFMRAMNLASDKFWCKASDIFTVVNIGEPLEGKALERFVYENIDKKRKKDRDALRISKEYWENQFIKSFETCRERKKRLKRQAAEDVKREEFENTITRDRLGFDNESFKTIRK